MSLYFPSISPRSSGSTRRTRTSTIDLDIKSLANARNWTTDINITAPGKTTRSLSYNTDISLKRAANKRTSTTDLSIVLPASSGLPTINTWVFLAMENQSYDSVFPTASFCNSLLSSGSTIPNYNGGYPGSSAASYTAIIGGNIYGVIDGVGAFSIAGRTTIIQKVVASGRSFIAMQEDTNPTGNSAWQGGNFRCMDHFGFTQFATLNTSTFTPFLLQGNGGSCGTGLPNTAVNPDVLIAQLNSVNPPNYIWYTPNDTNNMHDPGNDVSVGDAYLGSFVGRILGSKAFQTGTAVLDIWWDEPGGTGASGAPANVLLSGTGSNGSIIGHIKPNFVSSATNYGHYSTLRTLGALWNLTPVCSTSGNSCSDVEPDGAGDSGAVIMSDIFQ